MGTSWHSTSTTDMQGGALLVLALVGLLLVGCQEAPPVTPVRQPASFEMIVIGDTACPEGVDATLCVRVRVANRGDRSGDGFCRLRDVTTTSGREVSVWGPQLELKDFPGHSTIERVLAWTRGLPEDGLSGYCEPGLRL
jgi:hypothetical protein